MVISVTHRTKAHLIPFLVIIISGCLSLSAQESSNKTSQIIFEKDYEEVQTKASKLTDAKKYRVKYTSENISPNAANKRLLLFEFVPPNRSHSVYDYYENGELRSYEEIEIGKNKYFNDNFNGWRKKTKQDEMSVYSNGIYRTSEFLYVGKELINDKTTELYQETETVQDASRKHTTIITEKCWINKDGTFARYSYKTSNSYFGQRVNVVENYEYDPSLKIEAPMVKLKRRIKRQSKK